MAEKKRESLWLRCVNLGDNPSDAEIEAFFKPGKPVKIEDLGLNNLGGHIGLSHYELEKHPVAYPSIQAFKKWHQYFYSIFEHWRQHEYLTDEQAEWIDKQVLGFTLKFRKTPLPEHPFDLTMMQPSQPIMKFIVTQFAEFLSNPENELRQCEAEDCQKYFVPTPRGRNQRFCSKTCYYRIRKRIERAEK